MPVQQQGHHQGRSRSNSHAFAKASDESSASKLRSIMLGIANHKEVTSASKTAVNRPFMPNAISRLLCHVQDMLFDLLRMSTFAISFLTLVIRLCLTTV
jgi:hypothetical protein